VDRRRAVDGQVRVHGVIGDVADRHVIFFDDEIITGGSVAEGAQAVLERGAMSVRAGCVHGTLVPGAARLLYASGVEHLAVTDTIPLASDNKGSQIAVCSVANLFAQAIRAIHDETSISALFN